MIVNQEADDEARTVKGEEVEVETKTEEQDVSIHVETRDVPVGRVALGAGAVLAVLFLAYVIYQSLTILLLLFIALLVATAIEPIVNWLRRGPFSRSAGILIVYSVLFLVLGLIGYVIVTVFLSQVGEFRSGLARSITEMRTSISTIDNPFIHDQVSTFLDVAGTFAGQVGSTPQTDEEKAHAVTATAVTLAEIFFGIITIFVVAFYWLSERTLVKRSLMSWLPAKRANRVRRVWDDIEVKVGGWVRGQLTLMVIVGLASAVGYFAMGIKYWPALALVIAIAEAIPLVGPYIGTAPAVLVALTQMENDGLPSLLGMDPINPVIRALMVVVFAVVLQTVEGNVLVPRVMKNSVGISPLAVIISILLGATLAGLAGALVAVPLAGALQVIMADVKAARESESKFEEKTDSAEQTRQDAGELVVAYDAEGETKTRVESAGA